MESPTAEEIVAVIEQTGMPGSALARALELPERTITRWRGGHNLPHALMWLGVLTRLRELGHLPAPKRAK